MATTFFTLLTTIGQAKLANAIALGQVVALTNMAVGDGNGNPTNPTESQTALVRETYRGAINQLSVDTVNPNRIYSEFVVPSSVGGWTVHEVGVFDSDGNLFAVANFPSTYKPIVSEGAGRDLIIRIIMDVVNSSVVTLLVDPNVVVASRLWVEDNFSFGAQVPGGLTRQILRKRTNSDGDVEWADLDGLEMVFPAIVEKQTLAQDQTIVTLSTVTTVGFALYIEGAREFEGDAYTIDSATQITLSRSYPEGTRIRAVQNDPMTAVAGDSIDYRTGTIESFLDDMFYGSRFQVATGYKSLNTGANDSDKWFKLGHTDIPTGTNYDGVFVLDFGIYGGEIPPAAAPSVNTGRVVGHVKKFGSTWRGSVRVSANLVVIDPTNFVLVKTTTNDRMELWAKVGFNNSIMQFKPSINDAAWEWFDGFAFSVTLPSNTATVSGMRANVYATSIEANKLDVEDDLTVGGSVTVVGDVASEGVIAGKGVAGGVQLLSINTNTVVDVTYKAETIVFQNPANSTVVAIVQSLPEGYDGQQVTIARMRLTTAKNVVIGAKLNVASLPAGQKKIMWLEDMSIAAGTNTATYKSMVLRYAAASEYWMIVSTGESTL